MTASPSPPATLTTGSDSSRTFASRGGWPVMFVLFVCLAALRVAFILRYRIDSDEPQHLHIVWGWTRHLLQYRDVFDNHTPLFHLFCIPIFQLVGERADALIFMRFAMVLFFAGSLWCVHRLGVLLRSSEAGWWAAVFAALSPAFCFTSTEFRADDMWTTLWLVSLVVLLGGELTPKRGLAAGLLFGATLATSLKTLALLGCLGVAAVVGLLLAGRLRAAIKDTRSYVRLGALLAGSIVVPGLLALWLAKLGILREALYGIFSYNSVPGLGRLRTSRDIGLGMLEMAVAIAVLIPLSAWMARRVIAPERRLRFHLVFLGSGFYGALIYTLWPLLDAEHFVPFQPLIITGLMPLLLDTLARATAHRFAPLRLAVPAVAAFIILAVEARFVRTDAVASSIRRYADLLRLSEPTDYVMDLKGESIFRPRPCQYLFEGVGIARAQQGLMPDDLPEKMIEKKTCITIQHNYRFVSPHTLAFMDGNYIPVCYYRVLGHAMKPATAVRTYTFEIVIPETYAFVSGRTPVTGTLDGQPCRGSAALVPGTHTLVADETLPEVNFVWQQAIDRGFFPKKEKPPTHPDSLSKPKKQSK